jgi:hypothetical protein
VADETAADSTVRYNVSKDMTKIKPGLQASSDRRPGHEPTIKKPLWDSFFSLPPEIRFKNSMRKIPEEGEGRM